MEMEGENMTERLAIHAIAENQILVRLASGAVVRIKDTGQVGTVEVATSPAELSSGKAVEIKVVHDLASGNTLWVTRNVSGSSR